MGCNICIQQYKLLKLIKHNSIDVYLQFDMLYIHIMYYSTTLQSDLYALILY